VDPTHDPIRKTNERLGNLQAEVHWIRAGKDAEIALTRIPVQNTAHHGTPVVLVHGNFTDRGFWISQKGIGLAPFLAGSGYDPWVLELRGHGRSPKGTQFSRITAEEHIKEDLPATVHYVFGKTRKPMFLVGHSAGGIFVAATLSAACVNRETVLGAALFGAQITHGERFLKFPPLAGALGLLLRLLGRVPSKRLGLGPEPEPAAEMLEFMRWKRLGGKWEDSRGFSYHDGLASVTVPVLAVAAARDSNDPPKGCSRLLESFGSLDKQYVLLGREQGFLEDYKHISMIVSKAAAREVWPLLARWMDERRNPGA
jgi:pimeloyl-ACP methyl ester carboxylesterase